MQNHELNCPVCSGKIIIELDALIGGATFGCQNCQSKVSLSHESVETVSKTVAEFKSIKRLKHSHHDKI